MARHRARQQTLQLLFEWDLRRTPLDEIVRGYYDSLLVSEDVRPSRGPTFLRKTLLRGVDRTISRPSTSRSPVMPSTGSLQRMPAVDRNILRLAVYEMLRTDTPPAVVIDEALELARRFPARSPSTS